MMPATQDDVSFTNPTNPRSTGMKTDESTDSLDRLDPEQHPELKPIFELAETCTYEASHSIHVTRLALQLFDELHQIHQLGDNERFWLTCAGILHDIGWTEGWRAHHKTGLHIILSTAILPFNNRDRLIVGSIVRYHRKALPSTRHDHFAALEETERQKVKILAAILRFANGLDRSHRLIVQHVRCKIFPKRIAITCYSSDEVPQAELAAQQILDLLAKTFKRRFSLKFKTGTPPNTQVCLPEDSPESQPA